MTTTRSTITDPVWIDSDRSMTLGLSLPMSEGQYRGSTPHFNDYRDLATAARDAGLDVLWMADHFSFENEETGEIRGAWEVFTLIAGLSAAVPDINFGVMVACTGYRNPGVIAKMTEMIDDISGGRFILGLGAGWNKPEYDQFGMPFDHRVSRFEEAIEIIHGLLRSGEANVDGRFYQAKDAVNKPRGPRANGAPILVGSTGQRMMRILGRYADAWDGASGETIDDVRAKISALETAVADVERAPESVIKVGGLSVQAKDDGEFDVEQWVERLSAYRELGIRHVRCGLPEVTPATIDAFGAVIRAYDQHG